MVSHILKRDPTYPKQVREEEEELRTREESSGSCSIEPILAQARKSRLFKISDLTLSLKRGSSRSSENLTASTRFLSLKRPIPRFGETPRISNFKTLILSLGRGGETKVALNLSESKVDVEVVHKMGFFIDPVTRRTYKYRTDRQTTATDEPEPIAPNPPASHVPSSSSATMPSNQMIMDELVSLRGFITTRMDAFDT
ncbi:hypothetical protein Lal_00023595 [Lupinus albus]|nr:hypothetical protein Lal_00023595 [Lupinus albus]